MADDIKSLSEIELDNALRGVGSDNVAQSRTDPFASVYDLDYFCLTDENFLLVKRSGHLVQIKPSEFLDGDLLPALDICDQVQWVSGNRTTNTVFAGDKIVRLVTQRGVFYLTTGHKMFKKDGSLEAAGNLRPGDHLRHSSTFRLSEDSSIGVDKAYLLGAYAAEGHSIEGCNDRGTGQWRLCWSLHHDEDFFSMRISSYLSSAFPGAHCQIDLFPQYTRRIVACYNKEVVQSFRALGALGLCSDKRVPSCVFTSTKHEKAAFVAAIIEGDGTYQGGRAVVLRLTSKALVDGVHLLLEDLGINSKLGFSRASQDNHKDQYTLRIYGKNNLRSLLCYCSGYWLGWKHLPKIQEYSESKNGNIKHTIKDIKEALLALYPMSADRFSLQSGIPQAAIKRLFGSWNLCLKHFGYPVKNSRWGINHEPVKVYDLDNKLDNGLDYASDQVIDVEFLTLKEDILVYDFTVPGLHNFLLNTICSHNSGSQCFLYIGDVWVDEITSLQYQITQNKQPLYGYASQLFDATAAGQVLVQGSFSINFKEQGYLWAVLRRYFQVSSVDTKIAGAPDAQSNLLSPSRKAVQQERLAGLEEIVGATDTRRPTIGNGTTTSSQGTRFSTAPIERLVAGGLTIDEEYQMYGGIAGYATFDTDSPKDALFEDLMEVFEDQIWKGDGPNNAELLDQIRRPDNNIFDGFDMYVVFGNYLNDRANHTVSKIIGVRLTSQGKVVQVGGQPILEEYSFIARSVV